MNHTRITALILSMTLISLSMAACGGCAHIVEKSGEIISAEQPLEPFTRLDLRGGGTARFHAATRNYVVITTDSNMMEYVSAEVENGALILKQRRSFSRRSIPLSFDIYTDKFDALTALSISGSGDVTFVDPYHGAALSAAISGSGRYILAGTVTTLHVSISGSGNFDGGKLEADEVSVSVAGSGKSVVWAKQTLNTTISGSGLVEYAGLPKVTSSISGSGKVRGL